MKSLFNLVILMFSFILFEGCKPKVEQVKILDNEIKKQMSDFYTAAQVDDYSPINYSQIDTIQFIKDLNGNLIRLTGKMGHTFTARSKAGNQEQYTDTFDIAIFKDAVIVTPRGY